MTNTYVRLRYVTRVLAPRGTGIPGPAKPLLDTFRAHDSIEDTLTGRNAAAATLAASVSASRDFKSGRAITEDFASDTEDTAKFT